MSTDEVNVENSAPAQSGRLDSWKEIAVYLGRDVRTVQRWEKKEGLPVHRHIHEKLGTVYAYKSEIDTWWNAEDHIPLRTEPPDPASAEELDEVTEEELLANPTLPSKAITWFNLHRMWFAIAAAALSVLAAGYGIYELIPRSGDAKKVRLIVLPLETYGGVSQDPFAQGMTEELIAELGRLNPKQLGVIARTTSTNYKGKTLATMRKDLDIDYVIEGSVFRDKDRARITVQLINARDETHTWAKSYEEDLRDVIALQDNVATAIADEIKIRLVHLPQPTKVNPQAYEAFLRGRYFWNKRSLDGVRKSLEYFNQAIQLDPTYAPPYAGLADGFAVLGSAQSGAVRPDVGFPRAKQLAIKAISLDPTLAEPHASLGYIHLVYDHDPKAADREFKRALELNPRYVTALQWYGQYYESLGDMKSAIDSVNRALDQEPMSLPVNIALTEAFYYSRDYNKAIDQGLKTIEIAPASALAHFNLGRAYSQNNQHAKALIEFQQAHDLANNPATIVPLGYTYGRMGQRDKAMDTLVQLDQLGKTQYVPAIYRAMIHLSLGEKDQAFQWLSLALNEHCDYMVFLSQDPMVDPLRSDPRFAELMKKVADSK